MCGWRRALFAVGMTAVGLGVAAFGIHERVSAEARLFHEAARLVDRSREIDAIQDLSARGGVGVGDRLRAARDTSPDRAEREAIGRALACSSDPTCIHELGALLQAVRERHADVLREAMASTESARAKSRVLTGIGALLAMCGALFGAWPGAGRPSPSASRVPEPGAERALEGGTAAESDERDLHLRSRLEELYALRLRALESDRFSAYGEIAAGLSHGLKTPLASIRAATELSLTKLGFEHPVAPHLEDALEEIDGLIEQVRRFLQASGDGEPMPTRVVLADLVRLLEGSYAPQASERGVRWRSEVEDGGAPVVADPALLEMALRNLVENALAVAPSGTTVSVAARSAEPPARAGLDQAPPPVGRWVEIAVVDEGPGIPADLVAGARRPSEKPGGSGLGLAIARRIAARHGGALEVSHGAPRGTSVHLRLPAAPVGEERPA